MILSLCLYGSEEVKHEDLLTWKPEKNDTSAEAHYFWTEEHSDQDKDRYKQKKH